MNLYFWVRFRIRFRVRFRVHQPPVTHFYPQTCWIVAPNISVVTESTPTSTRKLWLHQLIYYYYSRFQHRHEELFEFQSKRKYFAVKITENKDRKLQWEQFASICCHVLTRKPTFDPFETSHKPRILHFPAFLSQPEAKKPEQIHEHELLIFLKCFLLQSGLFGCFKGTCGYHGDALWWWVFYKRVKDQRCLPFLWFWALCSSGWLLQPPPPKKKKWTNKKEDSRQMCRFLWSITDRLNTQKQKTLGEITECVRGVCVSTPPPPFHSTRLINK